MIRFNNFFIIVSSRSHSLTYFHSRSRFCSRFFARFLFALLLMLYFTQFHYFVKLNTFSFTQI